MVETIIAIILAIIGGAVLGAAYIRKLDEIYDHHHDDDRFDGDW